MSPASDARHLMRSQSRAALGTLQEGSGAPYVSLVMVAVDHDASPLLLLSDLAQHSRNLAGEDRVSMLFDGTAGLAVALTGQRVTVQGRITRLDDDRPARRYQRRHPDAALYRSMADFHFYRMIVERAHLVAGFGRIHWIEAGELLPVASEALLEAENGIVAHMNEDHADALALYAQVLLGRGAGAWEMTGIDPEGLDLRCATETARLSFERPVTDAQEARAELVRLVRAARERSAP